MHEHPDRRAIEACCDLRVEELETRAVQVCLGARRAFAQHLSQRLLRPLPLADFLPALRVVAGELVTAPWWPFRGANARLLPRIKRSGSGAGIAAQPQPDAWLPGWIAIVLFGVTVVTTLNIIRPRSGWRFLPDAKEMVSSYVGTKPTASIAQTHYGLALEMQGAQVENSETARRHARRPNVRGYPDRTNYYCVGLGVGRMTDNDANQPRSPEPPPEPDRAPTIPRERIEHPEPPQPPERAPTIFSGRESESGVGSDDE